MSKQRYVDTKFWDDTYTVNLDPIEKLMFLYLLTNPLTNLVGIFEIQLRRIAFDTGIDKEMVARILERFEKDSKTHYVGGWLAIKNFAKHQNFANPKLKVAIQREISLIPAEVSQKLIGYGYPIDELSHLDLDLDSNLDSNLEPPGDTLSQQLQDFFTNPDAREPMLQHLLTKGVPEKMARDELVKFVSYWTETSPKTGQPRWKLEKFFDIKRRLATWFTNANKFKK